MPAKNGFFLPKTVHILRGRLARASGGRCQIAGWPGCQGSLSHCTKYNHKRIQSCPAGRQTVAAMGSTFHFDPHNSPFPAPLARDTNDDPDHEQKQGTTKTLHWTSTVLDSTRPAVMERPPSSRTRSNADAGHRLTPTLPTKAHEPPGAAGSFSNQNNSLMGELARAS